MSSPGGSGMSGALSIQGPLSSTVMIGQTAQFTATSQNLASSSVNWQVNSVPGGNTTFGTISNTGLYTAPNAVPTPNQIQITAVSVANSSISASTTITLGSNISVTTSPHSVSMYPGQTQQFSVDVQNAVNVAVTWEVNGVVGGTAATGSITGNGLYTAPTTVSSATMITVSAVSVADPTKSGSAAISISPAVSVSVTPLVATVFTGNTLQFSVSVQNTSNTSVTWQIGSGQGAAQVGTISSSGLYTPPATTASPVFVVISATSVADPLQSGTAWIIVNSPSTSNASLKGQYVFNVQTQCAACADNPFTTQAGSFAADGAGNITSGVVELVGAPGSFQNVIGAYSVNASNQSEIEFLSVTGGVAKVSFLSFVVGSFNQSIAARGDVEAATGQGGAGGLFLQDPGARSMSAINGDYAFGTFVGTVDEALAGVFHADGQGNLSSGFLDVNNPFPGNSSANLEWSAAPFTGTYDVDDNTGRGTATLAVSSLGTVNVEFYVVSANELLWLGTTPNSATFSGSALLQSGAPFSVSSLNATGVFAIAGAGLAWAGGTPFYGASIGLMTADGNGHVTGIVDGTVDSTGNLNTNQPYAGVYAMSPNGRGTLTIFNQLFVIYMVRPNSAFVLEAPNNPAVQTGIIQQQSAGPFSLSSISGSFSSGGNSSPLDQTTGFTQDAIVGTFASDGAGNITGNASASGIYNIQATYTVSGNGRGTLTAPLPARFPQDSFPFYMISPNAWVALTGLLNASFLETLTFFGP